MLHIKSKMKALLVSLGAGLFLLGNNLTVEAGQAPIYYDEETDTAYFIDDAIFGIDRSVDEDGSLMIYLFEDGTGIVYGNGELDQLIADENIFGMKDNEYSLQLERFVIADDSNPTINQYFFCFTGCSNLKEVEFKNINHVSDWVYSSCMFSDCSSITEVDFSNSGLNGLYNMCETFKNCTSLQFINMNGLSVGGPFAYDTCYNCPNLEKIIAPKYSGTGGSTMDFGKTMYNESGQTFTYLPQSDKSVTYTSTLTYPLIIDLSEAGDKSVTMSIDEDGNGVISGNGIMFSTDYFYDPSNIIKSLKTISIVKGSTPVAGESLCSYFCECTNLQSINLTGLNTSNVTDMSYMFADCTALTSLDLSNFNTSSVTNMSHMFYNCESLTSLDLSSFDTSNVTDMSYMFA